VTGDEPVQVEAEPITGRALVATGTFLSDSPFPSTFVVEGRETVKANEVADIVNGQRNSFSIVVENLGQGNVTLKSVQGTFIAVRVAEVLI
jgi:hypothetical protein